MIADAYVDEDRNLVLLPKFYYVSSIDDNGTPENRFANSLHIAAGNTGEKLTLDFSPFGDKVVLRSSNGRECPFLIRPTKDKKAFLEYDTSLQLPEVCYCEWKKSLEDGLHYFKPFERLNRYGFSRHMHDLLKLIEVFAKNHKLLCIMPNTHEQAEILVAKPDFAYGKDYSSAWQRECQRRAYNLRVKEHAPRLLFQSKDFMVNSITQNARVRLYELAEDAKYLVTLQSLRGSVETSYMEKEIDGNYNRACGAFDSACMRMNTRPEDLKPAERLARLADARKEADRRFAVMQAALGKSRRERSSSEEFLAMLAEDFEQDPLCYGEGFARRAIGMGWTEKEIKSALRLYAPDAALDSVSKELPFADRVIKYKDRNKYNICDMDKANTKGNSR